MAFSAQHIKQARLALQKSDPVMKRIIKQVGPFTAKARRDRYATLVQSILSQQISTAAARTIRGRLETAMAAHPSHRANAWQPEVLAGMSIEDFRELGVSRQKASYVIDLTEHVMAGTLNLKSLSRLGDDDVIASLTQVKGVGVWTAQMFLMFSLGRMDVFPSGDLGIRKAIQRNYEFEELPTVAEMEPIADKWRPFATVASWYLWRSLELDA